MVLQDKYDEYSTLAVLGQTLTSTVANSGSRALGDVHASTKEEAFLGLAKWVAANGLKQLASAICRLNYGNTDECPTFEVDTSIPENPQEKATRLSIVTKIVKCPQQWVYEQLGVPLPKDGEPTIGGIPEPVNVTPGQPGQPKPGDEGKELPPKKEAPGDQSDLGTEAREMLTFAGGNGDKHNRVYQFISTTELIGNCFWRKNHACAGGLVQITSVCAFTAAVQLM